jgi:hypothetical protein
MAKVFAPFPIQRTMCNLTFYIIDGRNFVRQKSSLTRRKVLYSPQFANTRHNAELMAKASKIGSLVYNALPGYWRQGWMYRSFTGEAYKMLKARKCEKEIEKVLYQQYVEPVISKQPTKEAIAALPVQAKRTYHKQDTAYWKGKTEKSNRRKAHKQKVLYNASLLGQASKIGSKLYARLPRKYANRGYYQYLTGLAMKLLKQEIEEADIITGLLHTLPGYQVKRCFQPVHQKHTGGLITHPNGQCYFIPSLYKRFDYKAGNALTAACYNMPFEKELSLKLQLK